MASMDLGEENDSLPRPIGKIDLEERAKTLGIKYFIVAYSSLNSDMRCSVVPACAIREAQEHGVGIHGSMNFTYSPSEPEMFVVPDPQTLIQLPWKPDYGWMASDLYLYNKRFAQCPRWALKKTIKKALQMGFVLKSGVEPEFILLNKEINGLADKLDRHYMVLHDPYLTMRRMPYLTRVSEAMEKLGWGPYELEHEGSNCQYEIVFNYADALTTSDRVMFMKFMIKELAEEFGVKASFMPVPLPGLLCASGLHVNVSLWSADTDKNLFPDKSGDLEFSQLGYHFLAGLLEHVAASTALMCPTVNSFKRLNKGAFCPNTITWAGNNRTVLFRIPANNRIEHRLPDGATNPYLCHAVILAAGLNGIERKLDPGPKIEGEVDSLPPDSLRRLPLDFMDAMRTFQQDAFMQATLGKQLVDGFVAKKQKEWKAYTQELTQFEVEHYWNC